MLSQLKAGIKKTVKKYKHDNLTIPKMQEAKKYVSPKVMEDIIGLLWKRIRTFISNAREKGEGFSLNPNITIDTCWLKATQLAVLAMNVHIFFLFTVGWFGARRQFVELQVCVYIYFSTSVSVSDVY